MSTTRDDPPPVGGSAAAVPAVVPEVADAFVMPEAGAPLEVVRRPVVAPGPGEVLVRVRGSSLNYHDVVNLMGLIPGPFPRVPMTDGAGEVVAVGAGADRWRPGDRVLGAFHPRWLSGPLTRYGRSWTPGDSGDGWLQQYVTVDAEVLTRTPDHLDDVEAATLVCAGTTAWSALEAAGVRTGDVVLTQGTGGVSVFALQLAKARGATVIVTSSSDEKLERVRALGADHTVNHRTTPAWEREVRALTDGVGADLVLDLGGEHTLGRSARAARIEGHVAVIGVLSGHGEAAIPVSDVMTRQIRLQGVSVGSVAAHRDLARAVAACGLVPHVSHRVAATDVAEAVRVQQAGEHLGKIGIEVP